MDKVLDPFLPHAVRGLCIFLRQNQAKGIIVGGWVRDRLLNIPPEPNGDIDIEVYHRSYADLKQLLTPFIEKTYPQYGVLCLKNNIDLTLPRKEICIGRKYHQFQIQLCPQLSFKEAALRRDFTLNAMGWDPLAQTFYDPFHGQEAIVSRKLHPISEHFKEDAYRVLRAAQLIARFNLQPSSELITFASTMDPQGLSANHILKTQHILDTHPYKTAAIHFLQTIHWDFVLA